MQSHRELTYFIYTLKIFGIIYALTAHNERNERASDKPFQCDEEARNGEAQADRLQLNMYWNSNDRLAIIYSFSHPIQCAKCIHRSGAGLVCRIDRQQNRVKEMQHNQLTVHRIGHCIRITNALVYVLLLKYSLRSCIYRLQMICVCLGLVLSR